MTRTIVWVIIVLLTAFTIYKLQSDKVVPQIDKLINQLSSENIEEAVKAYWDLHNLYYTSWDAYDYMITKLYDSSPIHFMISLEQVAVPGKQAELKFQAESKNIFFESEQTYCKTAGDALMTIIYNEKKWKTDFDGNWSDWWYNNREYYVRKKK